MQPLAAQQPVSQFHSYLTFDKPWYITEQSSDVSSKDIDTSNFLDMLPKRYSQSAAPVSRRTEPIKQGGKYTVPNEREWKKALREKRDNEKQTETNNKLLNRRNKMEPIKAEPLKKSRRYAHVKSKVDSNLQYHENGRISSPRNQRFHSEPTATELKNAPANHEVVAEYNERTHSAVLWRPGATFNRNNMSNTHVEDLKEKHRRVLSANTYKDHQPPAVIAPTFKSARDRAKSASVLYETIMKENYQNNRFIKPTPNILNKGVNKNDDELTTEMSQSSGTHQYNHRTNNSDDHRTNNSDNYRTNNGDNHRTINSDKHDTNNGDSYHTNNGGNYRARNSEASLSIRNKKISTNYELRNGKSSVSLESEIQKQHVNEKFPSQTIGAVNQSELANSTPDDMLLKYSYNPARPSTLLSKFPSLYDESKAISSTSAENLQYEISDTTSISENVSMESRSLSLPNLRSASGSTYYYKQRIPSLNNAKNERLFKMTNDHETRKTLNVITSSADNVRVANELEHDLKSRVDEINKKLNVNKELLSHEVESSKRIEELTVPRRLSYTSKFLRDSIDLSTIPVDFDSNSLADSRRKSRSEASLPSVAEAATNRMYSWLDNVTASDASLKEETMRQNRTWEDINTRDHDSFPHVKKQASLSVSMPVNLNLAGRNRNKSILKKNKKVHIDLDYNRIYVYTPEYDMPVVKWPYKH